MHNKNSAYILPNEHLGLYLYKHNIRSEFRIGTILTLPVRGKEHGKAYGERARVSMRKDGIRNKLKKEPTKPNHESSVSIELIGGRIMKNRYLERNPDSITLHQENSDEG